MIRPISRAFSSFIPTGAGKFNITNAFQRLKNTVRAPVKHIKRNIEPSAADYSPMTNTTEEAFDEVAQEWQALIVGNSFDVNTMNMLEQAMTQNFGTVDNPHVIFTSDAPFRYVGCTGQSNEDDYEGHEFLLFMLREGPLQRCPSCGQVYKLVRLRNEFTPEMDYYISNLIPYYMDEMGEMDQVINMSLLRFQKDSYEHSQFETPSRMVYNLVNPDEHDRLLTDPAYRLERSKKLEEKLYVYLYSLQEIEKEWEANFGAVPRYPVNKVDYETLIDVEKNIMKLDRLFRQVDKFNNRKYIDRENHERREKRLRDRANDRLLNNYTFYYGGLTEEEQKYRDYFETDLENEPEDEQVEQKLDELEIMASGDYNLDKYDFQELYTRLPEEDATSFLEKKAFKFKYRQASDSIDNYHRRQDRMIKRQLERLEREGFADLTTELSDALENGKKAESTLLEQRYLEILAQESVHQYRDYFESDAEEDFTIFDKIAETDKITFMKVLENYAVPTISNKGHLKIPKREWDNSEGLWTNFFYSLRGYTNMVFPRAREMANIAERGNVEALSSEEIRRFGVYGESPALERDAPEAIEAPKKVEKPKVEEKPTRVEGKKKPKNQQH